MKKITFILLFIVQIAHAQNFSFRQLDERMGFLSDEVFDIVQDKDGIMWFATPYGIFSYNGLVFKNYTTENGLCSNSIIRLYKDYKNRIWAVSNKGELSVIEKGKIHSFAINLKLRELIYPGIIDNIYIDTLDNIYLNKNIGGIYQIIKFKTIKPIKETFERTRKLLIHSFKQHLFIDFYSYRNKQLNKKLFPEDSVITLPLKNEFSDNYIKKRIFRASNGDLFISLKNTVFHLRKKQIISSKKFKNEITDIQEDQNKRLWISFMYDGIKIFTNLSLQGKVINIFKKQGISKIFLDKDKNLWIASLGHSLYFLDNLDFEIFSPDYFKDFNVVGLTKNNNFIYTLNADKSIWRFNPIDNSFSELYKNNNELSNFKNITIHQPYIYAIGKDFFKFDNNGSIIEQKKISGINIAFSPEGRMFLLLYDHIQIYNPKTNETKDLNFKNKNIRPTCIAFFSENDYWIGTSEGLYRYQQNKFIYWGDKANYLRTRIQDIKIKDSICFIAVRGKGLTLIKGAKIKQISRANGLSDNFINKICMDKNGILWTANKNGLNKIIFGVNGHLKITNYTIKNALPTNNIRDIISQNKFMYLATNKGLVKFNTQSIASPKEDSKIIIDSLVISSIRTSSKADIYLDANKKLKIYFKAIAYSENSKAYFSYQIDSIEESLLIQSPLKIGNLKSGVHYLYFFSGKNRKKKQLFFLKIIQKPPVKESTLSKIIYLVLFISLIFGVAKLSASVIQKRAKEKEKFMLLQHKALKTQINPMFFYHSVETVRQLLLKRKTAKADNYLTDFTLLLRNLIVNSNYNFIPINQELSCINIYLSLFEQKYQLDKFTNRIIIEDKQLSIPPLLLFSLIDAFMGKAQSNEVIRLKIKLKKENENFYRYTNQLVYLYNWMEKQKINAERIIFIKERINLLNKIYALKIKIEYKKEEDREKERITETYSIIFPINFRNHPTFNNFKLLFKSLI